MIDAKALLADLQKLLTELEDDLRERCGEVAEVGAHVRAEYDQARAAGRTAQALEVWRDDYITQVAVAWILGCVFVRFCEDNDLIAPVRLSGPTNPDNDPDREDRLALARDRHTMYFREHPRETDREYLLDAFEQMARLPGAAGLFDRRHNPIWELGPSGDGAVKLLAFWQRIDPESGKLRHDFTCREKKEEGRTKKEENTDSSSASPLFALRSSDLSSLDTRFLGDLYQDLSATARKKYALLQTPEFVEEFILDRTLEPALDEFGLDGSGQRSAVSGQRNDPANSSQLTAHSFKMIDPACGSGHFLLGGFERLFKRLARREPNANPRELAQRALDAVYGVDLNPFAVAIARFRLLVAALKACDIRRLADAPGFRINLAAGDSLLHGVPGTQSLLGFHELAHHYTSEDAEELQRILKPGTYHAVVANPPYITPKDHALNQAYRERYASCHRQYSLAVPFMERIFGLAVRAGDDGRGAGYAGQITATSFMKREFGKTLIEGFLGTVDLTHVIDTSGVVFGNAGFGGTSTVILFGRNRHYLTGTIRAVMGLRGEPGSPKDPAHGKVWSAIVANLDVPDSETAFISVRDLPRETFLKHPWSLGGGGAAELKAELDRVAGSTLNAAIDSIGFLVITGEDNCLLLPEKCCRRAHLQHFRPLADGETIRDWNCSTDQVTLWPNTQTGERLDRAEIARHLDFLWQYRASLKDRRAFSVPVERKGIPWWCLRELYSDRLRTPFAVVFAFIATHNHFLLDRGERVFNRSAPVIKLPPDASEEEYLGLLGLLNSSTACFWQKQVCHSHGAGGGTRVKAGRSPRGEDNWESHFEHDGTKLKQFPLPAERPLRLARLLDKLAGHRAGFLPAAVLKLGVPKPKDLETARSAADDVLGRMVATQEELDWQCYQLYGLLDEQVEYTDGVMPSIRLGQRAFEIVMARRMAAGELETTWFERHGSAPITEIPADWPEEYQRIVRRRIEIIETDHNIGLIERPEYKRRWNVEPWDAQLERALRNWLLDRLEGYFDYDGRMKGEERRAKSEEGGQAEPQSSPRSSFLSLRSSSVFFLPSSLASAAKIADVARADGDFLQVAELYRGHADFDVAELVAELIESESVPFLPALRYKETGLRKRAVWERVWDLQRAEDAIDARAALAEGDPRRLSEEEAKRLKAAEVGDIPVPPKYASADFAGSGFWRLRGKLDVPKERWVSYPHCSREADPSLLVGWAGWNHLQQAQALAGYCVAMKEHEGWPTERLTPLLAGLLELLPWVKQWHNAPDPDVNLGLGDYYQSFVDEEARSLGLTLEAIRGWKPAAAQRRRRGRVRK